MSERPDGATIIILCCFAAMIAIVFVLFFPWFTLGLAVGSISSWWILRWLNGPREEEVDADDRG